jgi:hypothetical protein
MIEEAICTRLSGTAGLIALVPAAQITYRLLKQNSSYPAIRFFKVSAKHARAPWASDPGLVHARWQFDVYDPSANNVRNAREQLRLALERWRGTNLSAAVSRCRTRSSRTRSTTPSPSSSTRSRCTAASSRR